MDENSDIRLGGRLMATATLICAGFAAATLIPVLHSSSSSTDHDSAAAQQAAIEQQPAESAEYIIPPAGGSTQLAPPVTAGSDTGTTVRLARSVAQDYPGPNGQGVYVPVTVHPVTVTVDGAAFAEQLSSITNGVNEMLTVQRNVLESQLITQSPGNGRLSDWNAPAPQEARLNEIDATLRQLTESVETLRSESHLAANRLQQAENTAELLQEFQRTLAEHRQILAQTSQRADPAAPRIAQHPGTAAEPLVDDAAPADSGTQLSPWIDPFDAAPSETQGDVPLPIEPKHRVPLEATPPAEFDAESIEFDPESVRLDPDSFEFDEEPAGQAHYESVSPNTPIGMMGPVPVIATLSASEEQIQVMPASQVQPALRRIPDAQSQQNAIPETADAYPHLVPELPLESRPIVFEQTVTFALPPASDTSPKQHVTRPSAASQKTVVQVRASRTPAAQATVSQTPAPRAPGTIRTTAVTAAPSQPRPVRQKTAQPAAARTTNRPASRFTAPRPVYQPAAPHGDMTLSRMGAYRRQSASRQSQGPTASLRRGVADGLDAVKDFGNDLRDRAADMMGRQPRRPAPRTTAAAPRSASGEPSMMHRMGSVFRQAGRGQTIE